jgi:uncharacterized protein YbjT (DUF2867 family)
MKNVLLIGASGTLGKAVTKELLTDDSLKLTLFARSASRVFQNNEANVIDGDAAEIGNLKSVMADQDIVVCMVSGEQLPKIAENIAACMDELGKKRLIFTGAVGIYDEIPEGKGSQYNVSNEPPQVPNRKAVDIIEGTDLEYTILRPGFLRVGSDDDYVLSFKGEAANGYITTIPSLVKLIHDLISDDSLHVRESVSITKDMRG